MFAAPDHINTWMLGQFRGPVRDRYLVGRGNCEFAEAVAVYVNEINAYHPFVDGAMLAV
jgi:cell filamentation protein